MVLVIRHHFMEDIVAIIFLVQCRLLATNYYYFSAPTNRVQPVALKYIGMEQHKVKKTFDSYITRKCPLLGHILAPPEGLRALEVPRVNPGGRPQESGGDSKAIHADNIFGD